MPQDITFKFVGDDEVTPTVNKIKSEMAGLGSEAKGLGEAFKELSSGLGYNIGLWNLGFMASQKAIEAVGSALSVTIPSIEDYRHWMNTVGTSNAEAAASYTDLRAAALDTWTSIAETQKRSMGFIAAGFTPEQAVQETRMVQDQIRETGVDLSEAYQKAKTYGAGISDALKVGIAHQRDRPEILAQALDDQRFQNTLKYIQFEQHLRFQAAQRVQQDQHRMDNYAFEDRRTAIGQEMEDRHLMVNREMEGRHRAIGYEMDDRRRAMSWAAEDAARKAGLTTAVGAAMPGAFDVLQGKFSKQWTGYLGAQILKPEMEAGEAEIQKQTGIGPATIEAAMRAGMSPGIVLQAAQAAREEKRAHEQRAFELISVGLQRAMVEELRTTSLSQADEVRDSGRSLLQEGRTLARTQTASDLDLSRSEQNEMNQRDAEGEARDLRREDLLWDQNQRDLQKSLEAPRPEELGMGAAGMGGIGGYGVTGMSGGEATFLGTLPALPREPAVPMPQREPLSVPIVGAMGAKGDKPTNLLDKITTNTLNTAELLAALVKIFAS